MSNRRPVSPDRSRRPPTLVISPPAAGNIGDQALVESVLHNIPGDVHLVVRRSGDVLLDHVPGADRVITEFVLPDLLYGRGPAHRRDVRQLKTLIPDSSSVLVVGADIMDGRYCLRASIARSRTATLAADLGVPAAVLGFSWSTQPKRRAMRAIAKASRSGVVLYGRDPATLRRLHDIGLKPHAAADVVFTVGSSDMPTARRLLAELGVSDRDDYVLINASGLVGSTSAQTDAYVEVVRGLAARGIIPVLLPHVSRGGADDQHALDLLAGAIGTPVPRVRSIQLPDVIRGLCSRATAVVTGRMHLGVMALRMGTPAVIVSTQGKVEGLVEMFDMPECCVEPTGELSALVGATAAVVDNRDSYAARIRERLPMVIDLATRNFQTAVNAS